MVNDKGAPMVKGFKRSLTTIFNIPTSTRFTKVLAVTVFLIAILYSLSIKYYFTELYDPVFYSFLNYLPSSSIIILITFMLAIVLGSIFSDRNRIFYLMLLPSIYVIEVLSNYPNIWARDVYLHGQIWELDISGSINAVSYAYPKEYPGFFLVLYVLYKIGGFSDTRLTNLFILYPSLMFILALLYYLISLRVLRKPLIASIAVIVGFNLVMFDRNELTFTHANTRLFSLVLVLLFSILLLSSYISRKHSNIVLIIITSFALSISHVLFGLIPAIALLTIMVIYGIQKIITNNAIVISSDTLHGRLFLIILAITLTWDFYNYYNFTIATGGKSIISYIYHVMGLELLMTSIAIRESIPLFGVLLRVYYKVLIGVLTLIGAVYVFRSLFIKNSLMLVKQCR